MVITDAPPVNFGADGDEDHKPSLPKSLLLSAARMQFVPHGGIACKTGPATQYLCSFCRCETGERDPFVDAVLQEEGLSLDNRQPRGLEELADGYFDLIVTLTPLAHHTVLERMRGSRLMSNIGRRRTRPW